MNLIKIQEDKRGEFWALEGFTSFPEIKIIKTKKGIARGGCVHQEEEFFQVIEGMVLLFIGSNMEIVSSGRVIRIPENTPHYIISQTDSTIMEWGCNPKNNTKDPQSLKIVEVINETR